MRRVSSAKEREADQDSIEAHVIDVLGQHVWTKMMTAFGGRDINVPRYKSTLHPQHALVVALGMEDALLPPPSTAALQRRRRRGTNGTPLSPAGRTFRTFLRSTRSGMAISSIKPTGLYLVTRKSPPAAR